jgi:hypothetical protein
MGFRLLSGAVACILTIFCYQSILGQGTNNSKEFFFQIFFLFFLRFKLNFADTLILELLMYMDKYF